MSRIVSISILIFGLFSLSPSLSFIFDTATPKAWAVVNTTVPEEAQPLPPTTTRLDLPVHYQITRARIIGTEATTETENYKETWTVELRSGGYTFLKSPRASIPAYITEKSESGDVPTRLVLLEKDFAALIGIKMTSPNEEEEDLATQKGKLITLHISRSERGSEFQINISEEEHLAVHLEVGQPIKF